MIMYRNPVEQWFWEGGYFNVAVAVLIVIATMYCYYGFIKPLLCKHKSKRHTTRGYVCNTCGKVFK